MPEPTKPSDAEHLARIRHRVETLPARFVEFDLRWLLGYAARVTAERDAARAEIERLRVRTSPTCPLCGSTDELKPAGVGQFVCVECDLIFVP